MYELTVTLPSTEIFDAYYYGYGVLRSTTENPNGSITFVVEYDAGELYNAKCQDSRFASGLYASKLSGPEN